MIKFVHFKKFEYQVESLKNLRIKLILFLNNFGDQIDI